MLKAGSIILSIWSGIIFLRASLILTFLIFLRSNAPILGMVFEKSEISSLDARVISAINSVCILYNSWVVALSLLALFVIWSSMINAQRWAFWALLMTIGFVQILGFIADAGIGNKTVPVSIAMSALYVVGIGLADNSIFKREATASWHQDARLSND